MINNSITMNIFKKKKTLEPACPVDRNKAITGFTRTIQLFAHAQAKVEPDVIPIYLYIQDRKSGNTLCFMSPTFFAKINMHQSCAGHGFSMVLNKTILGDYYASFTQSDVAKVFTRGKGIIDSPGCLHEKCEYYIKDFGYDADEASAVTAMLLEQVFKLKPEDVSIEIQLFGADEDGQDGQESSTAFDYEGNVIARSGFKHDLF